MGDDRSGLDLDEDDSLPWLEPADDYDERSSGSPVKLALLVLAGLGLIALVVGGIYWLQKNPRGGEGELIAAQEGDYKVAADDPRAREFEGEGDASYAASEGQEPDSRIDPSLAPEAPTIGVGKGNTSGSNATTRSANADAPAPATSSGVTIQLGAFGSQARANTAWRLLGQRVSALSSYSPTITSATVGGGKVYRLRTSARSRSAANSLCAAVRAKGENCIIIG